MALRLYARPFSSYSQKALIALYENATPFEYRSLEGPDSQAMRELGALWPMRRFPVLVDGDRTVFEASCVIEYLDLWHPGPRRLVPEDRRAALEVRMLDRFFDNYVSTPQQKVVFDRLRPEAVRTRMASWKHGRCSTPPTPGSSTGCGTGPGLQARSSAWPTARRRHSSSMRTGRIRFQDTWPTSTPIAAACWRGHRLRVPWTKHAHIAGTSRWALRIATERQSSATARQERRAVLHGRHA